MNKILKEVLSANETYAADFGDKADLPMPPSRRFAILTCMDARLDLHVSCWRLGKEFSKLGENLEWSLRASWEQEKHQLT